MILLAITSKQPNETVKQYKIRLFQNKDLYGITKYQIADLLNAVTGNNFNESTYRKWYAIYQEAMDDFKSTQASTDGTLGELRNAQLELEKERYKIQATKLELQKEYMELKKSGKQPEESYFDYVNNKLKERGYDIRFCTN